MKNKVWKIIGFVYADRRPETEKTKYFLWDQELWDVCDYIRRLENENYWLKNNPEYIKQLEKLDEDR